MDQKDIISIFIGMLVGVIFVSIFSTGRVNESAESVETESPPEVTCTIEIPTIETDEPIETEELIDEPVNERVSLGTFRITAYCPCSKCCGKWADGITKTGTVATEGRTIAVDPKVIPLGSVVEINGAEYIAEDIGGAIKENRIDMFFVSHEVALEWGVQYHEVFLIKEVS